MNNSKITSTKLILVVIFLSIFGLIMQYSASSYNALKETGDAFFYVKKQAISLIVAIVALFLANRIDTEKYKKYSLVIYIVSVVLLAIIFIPGLGVEKYGARRWLNLGFFTIQPSEISKFGLMFTLAGFISNHSVDKIKNLVISVLSMLLICVLVMLEPNMSITMLIGISTFIMLVAGGIKLKHVLVLAIPVIIALPILILLEPYRLKRLLAFLDPWANPRDEGFQLIQSYYALASGGLFGVGLFNSRQKYSFLPFSETDFIFAIIGEEFGFFGAVLLLLVFMYVIYLGLRIGINASTRYDTLLALGIVSIIAMQTILNIAVVTGSIPPTGLPLPFISNGGSSLVVFFFSIGILTRISKQSENTHFLKIRHIMK